MDWALYAAGWTVGWLLLWSTRRVPPAAVTARPAVAVIVPARDEAHALPTLLASLLPQLRPGDELVVVDDHSRDATVDVARACGAGVVIAADLPLGWVGKPHACWTGTAATAAPVLAFVDADVRPGPQLLDRLVAAVATDPGSVVSVQPWHDAIRPGEQLTALANVVALMGSGAFTVAGTRLAADVAFGPVLALDRRAYRRVGGHAHPDVRASLTEDIALARLVGHARLYSDRRDATFRMYPLGARQAVGGWSRTIAHGVGATRWWLLLGVVAWVWSLAGGLFTGWLAYPLSALQVSVLARRAGRLTPLLAALYPILVITLVVVVARAAWLRAVGHATWKGRRVPAA